MSAQHDSEHPERRGEPRHITCVPAQFETSESAGKPRTALIRDISVNGARLFTRMAMSVEEPVKLTLYFGKPSTEDPGRLVTAKVVRCAMRDYELSDVWNHEVAVVFDTPLHGFEEQVDALARRLAELGVHLTKP
jgi:hypothetical protein